MTMVTVGGYIPNNEWNKEISYVSDVYHTFVDKHNRIQFLVWNPFNHSWEIKDEGLIRPISLPAQDVQTNNKFKEYQKWEKEQKKNG